MSNNIVHVGQDPARGVRPAAALTRDSDGNAELVLVVTGEAAPVPDAELSCICKDASANRATPWCPRIW